jgi:hypothetical protein
LFLFVLLFLSLNWAGGEGAVPSKGEIISYFCKLASCVSHVYMYNFQSFFWRDVAEYLIYGENQVHCTYNNNLKQVMLTNNLIRVVIGGPLSCRTFLSHFTVSSFFQW